MNEQDIMKRIENETKDLPIPESISPSNMEKMLNEQIKQHNTESDSAKRDETYDNMADNLTADTAHKESSADAGNKGTDKASESDKVVSMMTYMRRRRVGLALAACFGVIILGSGAFGIIRHNMNSNSDYTGKSADYVQDEAAYEEAAVAEESAADADEAFEDDTAGEDLDYNDEIAAEKKLSDEEIEKQENEQLEKDLVASGVLSKPDSYEDYYDTVYGAYQKAAAEYKQALGSNEDVTIDLEEAAEAEADTGSFISDAVSGSDTRSAEKNVMTDSATSTGTESDDKNYSTTNTQEKTVDEGDIVKTDGEYIYTANRHGYNYYTYDSDGFPTISITKASNGKLTNVSTITLEAPKTSDNVNYTFKEFYIYNNYLIVLYEKLTEKASDIYGQYTEFDSNSYDYDGYYYSNDSWLFDEQSCIEIYDITDKKNPEKLKTLFQSGSYNSSRISDGYLYTISYFEPEGLAFHDYKKGRSSYPYYIPYINGERIAYDDIYYSRHLESLGTYVITSVDLSSPTRFTNSKAVSSTNSQVYVGEKSIYLYRTIYDEIQKTEIMRIGYSKGSLYIGSRAMIAGYLYGSFALSEYDKHLRIVSTIPANNFTWFDTRAWTDTAKTGNGIKINEDINAVYVLDENMHLTGKITGIAPGERIYSARFFGDTGYFVTYRNTDPLFSVDFSNPKEPKILGQLKIPGFSNYLHFYGNDTLLGIGEERDPYTQDFKGLKLSMFDISDPSNVTENDKLIIKNAYYSAAQYNHKAIMIDPAKNVFGFFYEYEDYDESGDYNYNYYYSTYTFDAKKGFIETARYKIDYDYMYDFENIRGLYIGNYFYLVTPQSIESYKLGSEEKIDSLYLD